MNFSETLVTVIFCAALLYLCIQAPYLLLLLLFITPCFK